MSNPVSNVEIEDVLSSIRRLVSDEGRAPIRETDAQTTTSHSSDEAAATASTDHSHAEIAQHAEPETGAGDSDVAASLNFANEQVTAKRQIYDDNTVTALVLTPSFRVSDEDEAAGDNDDASDAVADAEQATEVSDHDTKELLILSDGFQENAEEAQEQSSAASETHESDEGEATDTVPEAEFDDVPMDIPPFLQRPAVEEDDLQAVEVEAADSTAADLDAPQPAGELYADSSSELDPQRSIEDKIAELETLISRTDEDFEPDGIAQTPDEAALASTLPWRDSDEPRRAAVQSDVPDPDAATDEAQFTKDTIAFQQAHREATEAVEAEMQSSVAETLLETADQGAVLDEEALRDMVADIVRQELQGPLGERITRNVRKLVRREIYRALAANELD